jgi:hypothetical protein
MKPIQISGHARFEMQRRDTTEAEVEAVVRNPGQVLPARNGRQIHQSKVGPEGHLLLRVIVKDEPTAYVVVSAYKTSKVGKYWRLT